jgi:hypothetical protein
MKTANENKIDIEKIIANPKIRKSLAFKDPFWFTSIYLRKHISNSFAPFQMEMFQLIREEGYKIVAVMAFRGSGKSTILNLVNTLWSILGERQEKFVIIASKTQEQAKAHFSAIKDELRSNELLRKDFGPFTENEEDEWKKMSLELVYHDSKILSIHRDQSIRGIKHGPFRPGLIICDDLEDNLRSKDDKKIDIYKIFESEIVSLGDLKTRVFVLGNLISRNSLLMNLENNIYEENLSGIFRVYPILDVRGKNLWEEKFSKEDIKFLREKVKIDIWEKEYLLTFQDEDNYLENFYDDIEERCDPSEMEYVSGLLEKRYVALEKKYGSKFSDVRYQEPLIGGMKKYKIKIPGTGGIDYRPCRYEKIPEKYKEICRERKIIEEEYCKNLSIQSLLKLEKENIERVRDKLNLVENDPTSSSIEALRLEVELEKLEKEYREMVNNRQNLIEEINPEDLDWD